MPTVQGKLAAHNHQPPNDVKQTRHKQKILSKKAAKKEEQERKKILNHKKRIFEVFEDIFVGQLATLRNYEDIKKTVEKVWDERIPLNT